MNSLRHRYHQTISNWHTNQHVDAGSTLRAGEDRFPRSEMLPLISL